MNENLLMDVSKKVTRNVLARETKNNNGHFTDKQMTKVVEECVKTILKELDMSNAALEPENNSSNQMKISSNPLVRPSKVDLDLVRVGKKDERPLKNDTRLSNSGASNPQKTIGWRYKKKKI